MGHAMGSGVFNDAWVAATLVGIVGALFLIVCGLISWIGVRLHEKIDAIPGMLDERFNKLSDSFAREIGDVEGKVERHAETLHRRIDEVEQKSEGIAERITRVETKCDFQHRVQSLGGFT